MPIPVSFTLIYKTLGKSIIYLTFTTMEPLKVNLTELPTRFINIYLQRPGSVLIFNKLLGKFSYFFNATPFYEV